MYCKAIVWLQKLSHLQWRSEVLGQLTRWALNCIPPALPCAPKQIWGLRTRYTLPYPNKCLFIPTLFGQRRGGPLEASKLLQEWILCYICRWWDLICKRSWKNVFNDNIFSRILASIVDRFVFLKVSVCFSIIFMQSQLYCMRLFSRTKQF